jgi:hypothetical protein
LTVNELLCTLLEAIYNRPFADLDGVFSSGAATLALASPPVFADEGGNRRHADDAGQTAGCARISTVTVQSARSVGI